MSALKEGQKAPHFEGVDQNNEKISIDDFKGKKLVLFFYPKDNTSGCTKEACNLRDNYSRFIENGYSVVGVSPDSAKSHVGFIEKHSLPYPLIADTDKAILTAYGVWAEKKMYGRTYMGVLRTTFLISEKGLIESIITKVKTDDHTNQIFDNRGK